MNIISESGKYNTTKLNRSDFMSTKKNIETKNDAAEKASNDSKNAKNGYMQRGNSSKYAADQGTRNKN